MSLKANPINLAFDISTLKYNMKKKKKLQEDKDTSASMDKEDVKQKSSKGHVEVVNNTLLEDNKPNEGIEDKTAQKFDPRTYHYQDDTNISTLQLIIRNLEKELFDKKTEIRILSKNFKEKIAMTEVENKKLIDAIEDKYNTLLKNITNSSENQIKEISMQYETNTSSLQKEHVNLLNNNRMIRATHISIDRHKEKMNELNETWENKYNTLRNEYEEKLKQLFSKINEAIEMKLSLCRSSCNNNNSVMYLSSEEIIRTITKVQLEHEIGYSSYLFDLLGRYYQVHDQIKCKKTENLNLMKTVVIKKFNELLLLSDYHNNENKNKRDKRTKDNENSKIYHNRVNELVNYDSSKMHLSISPNLDDKDSQMKFNDISQERSKLHDNFTSEFESFNFNEDSLPNRNIQVLTPPDMIN